ncbi:DUF2247 family protein [Gordonia sp. CPCC 206044]|uniref:DUF2247 family protein n=1 Tax=Gordonia sp. CPCC 206044 TaxID=3140793 RepID=UPI003AF38026
MTDKLVTFEIPAGFIAERVVLTPAELGYGHLHQWISAEGVVALALSGVAADSEPMLAVEQLSLLLSDELDRVPELVTQLNPDDAAIWVYLTVAWVTEHPADFDDEPLQVLDKLYADFGYPGEMEGFVTYMPAPDGTEPGMVGLRERLDDFLAASADRFGAARRATD